MKEIDENINYKDLYIQTLADYKNLSRRSLEEKGAIAEAASNAMLVQILSLYHDAKRGAEYNEKGSALIFKAFKKFLTDNNVGIINDDFFKTKTGNKFSEEYAVAIGIKKPEEDDLFPDMAKDPSLDNSICKVVEDGFYSTKTNKVISFAKVIVYKNS